MASDSTDGGWLADAAGELSPVADRVPVVSPFRPIVPVPRDPRSGSNSAVGSYAEHVGEVPKSRHIATGRPSAAKLGATRAAHLVAGLAMLSNWRDGRGCRVLCQA
jgi:hypothetical protein